MQAKEQSNIELFKELEASKGDLKNTQVILFEINERISSKRITFKGKENKYLYLYMLLSSKTDNLTVLNKLITNEDFIKIIDLANINGSILLSLTDKCHKPREVLLKNSTCIKESILKEDSLFSNESELADLTNEEVLILREDQEIDNYLIINGLRFDALKKETIKKIEQDTSILENYDINTIRDFTNSYEENKKLANNKSFMKLYFSKLDNSLNVYNAIFNNLTIKQIKDFKGLDDNAYLHIIKDANPKTQKELLKDKKIQKILINCNDINVLNNLPKDYLISLLIEKENLLSGINLRMLKNLNKQELSEVAKKSKHYYTDLVEKIAQNDNFDFKPFITALPQELLMDLGVNKISEFNFDVLKKLLTSNKKFFKESILNNMNVSNYLVNRNNIDEILELLDDSDFNNEEKIRLLNNCTEIKYPKNVCRIIYTIPETLRLPVYRNDYLRNCILNEPSYELDSYTLKYLLNNIDEVSDKPIGLLLDLLNNCDYDYAYELLSNDVVLEKVFKEGSKTDAKQLATLVADKPLLVEFYKKDLIKQYYTLDLLNELKEVLSFNEFNNICSIEVINTVYNHDEELVTVYKKLLDNNSCLLNTLDFTFINEVTKDLKFSILCHYVKYPEIQKNFIAIAKKYKLSTNFLNQFYFATKDLDYRTTIVDILNVLRKSIEGENRKKIGNLGKMLLVAAPNEIPKNNFAKVINYILYFVPRYDNYLPSIIKTPITFNEIMDYENDFNDELTKQIMNNKNIKESFLLKHYKMTIDTALSIVNRYSIDRVDEKVYPKEYGFLSNLNNILKSSEEELIKADAKYKTITILDSFIIEEDIKNMYGKIFNYEIRSKTYANKPYIKEIFGKELQIYSCPTDFMFLISNIDITSEYEKTNSFLLGWHNTVNRLDGIHTSLISNDNLHLGSDIIFGFNGVLDSGIRDMSPYFYNKYNKYMTPRELIDYTRDLNNRLVIDKYAIRPNYNNSNLPTIEPDFIIIDETRLDDKTYLEKVSRASSEFKTKRNKEGLPIIAIDINKIANSEMKKIDNIFKKYQRNHDMSLLPSIITKINNNYTALRNYNKEVAAMFNPVVLIETVKKRIEVSNSISEIEYIENLFVSEEAKYKYIVKDFTNESTVKSLKQAIDDRLSIINKG